MFFLVDLTACGGTVLPSKRMKFPSMVTTYGFGDQYSLEHYGKFVCGETGYIMSKGSDSSFLHSEKWPRSTKIVIRLLQHDVVDVFTTRVNNTHHCEAELIEVVLHVNLFNILFRFYRVIIIYNTTNINFHIHVYNT